MTGNYAVGDTAYIDRGLYGRADVLAGVVVKVTPKGQVTVKCEHREFRFTPSGREVGSDTWNPVHLITKAQYDEQLEYQAVQIAERKAREALVEVSSKRPTADNKAEILALIDAARAAVEAL